MLMPTNAAARGDGVAAMMPGVGFHGGAFHVRRLVEHEAEQKFFPRNHGDEQNQSPRRRRDARFENPAERMIRNHAGGQQQHRGDDCGGERLGLAVAVGMVLVRRRLGHDQPAPDDDGTENVRERFHRVGDERLRMAEDAGEKFRDGQRRVHGEAEERGAQAALEAAGRHGELLTTKHKKRHERNWVWRPASGIWERPPELPQTVRRDDEHFMTAAQSLLGVKRSRLAGNAPTENNETRHKLLSWVYYADETGWFNMLSARP